MGRDNPGGRDQPIIKIKEIQCLNQLGVFRELRTFLGLRKAKDLFFREFFLLHVGLSRVDKNLRSLWSNPGGDTPRGIF